MTRELADSGDFWDRHAQHDPLWAILSDPELKGRRWDVRRFFETGVAEIALLFYRLHCYDIDVAPGRALDFGCGVGRLTQALAPRFERVVGIDVSPRMVDLASQLNRFPSKVSYLANQATDLGVLGDERFDLVYSNIVLQHIAPDIAMQFLRELFRVLAPGGVLVFQLPSHERGADDPPPRQATRAMPDDAYQASIAVAGVPSRPLAPRALTRLEIEVTNASPFAWSPMEFGTMSVGNHWLDATGMRMLQRDDGRAPLPGLVYPGERCRVPLTITMPASEGEYQCEVDLAHEGVLWFQDKGSASVRFAVQVRAQAGQGPDVGDDAVLPGAAGPTPASAPREESLPGDLPPLDLGGDEGEGPGAFPMHAIPRHAVRALFASLGAGQVEVEDDRSCGDQWVSFWYFVRKAV